MKANNPAIEQFIIDQTLITPVQKIINQLSKREFRDCDIKWLDKKLEGFVGFAAETVGVKSITQSESVKPKKMNDYAVSYYLKYFKQLLSYFKSLI